MTIETVPEESVETPEVNINVEVAEEQAVYVEVYPGGCGPGPTEVSADPGNASFISPNDGLIYTPAVAGGSGAFFAGDVPAGLDCAVVHRLGTRDVSVEVYRNSAPWDTIRVDTERTDMDTVTLRFSSAVTAGQFRAVIAAGGGAPRG